MKNIKLVSNDRYIVRTTGVLTDYDRVILTRLYQPLCGYGALSLYFTLWSELNNKYLSEVNNHHNLFELMQCNVQEFEQFRKNLEGLGLLKTYISNTDLKENFFYYELYLPLNADEFFSHVLYGTFLKQRLDNNTIENLKKYFKMNNEIEGYKEDISSNFNDVYKINYEDMESLKSVLSKEIIDANRHKNNLNLAFDLHILSLCMRTRGIKSEVLNDEVIDTINNMTNLYGFKEEEIAAIMENCLISNGLRQVLDLTKFQDSCYNNKRINSLEVKEMEKHQNKNKSLRKQEMWDQLSPFEFLQYKQNDIPPTVVDKNLIEDIISQTKLPAPVINVLLDYVLLTKNNSLPRKYVLTIAADLMRSGINDSLKASEYLKSKNKNIDLAKLNNKPSNDDALVESNPQAMAEVERLRAEYAKKKRGGAK